MVIVLGSFRLGFRGLRSSWHLRLLEADQQPGLRRVRAKVHEATDTSPKPGEVSGHRDRIPIAIASEEDASSHACRSA
jgi:hypothetical protein